MVTTTTPPVITVAPAGLAGFLCDVTEEPVSFTDCLHCAQHGAPGCSFAPAVISNLIRGIRDSDYANLLARENGAELGFSVTELVGCPRQFVLKKQNPYYEKVSAMYRMAFGSGYHSALAEYETSHGFKERTLTWKITFMGQTILLVGTPDLFEYSEEMGGWLITDYKVTANPPFGHKVPICVHCDLELHKNASGDKLVCPNCGEFSPRSAAVARVYKPAQARSSHALQVNLYALLIEKNAARLKESFPVKGAQIEYLGPKTPVRCEVTLDRDATMAFLQARLRVLLNTHDLPPVLDEVDELWRCDYCPVRSYCEQAHGGPVGKAATEESAEAEA